jgi:hypothetical protein
MDSNQEFTKVALSSAMWLSLKDFFKGEILPDAVTAT